MRIAGNKIGETKVKGNYIIWSIVALLILVSVLIVYSASLVDNYGNSSAERSLLKHVLFLIIGILTIFIIQRTDYRNLSRFSDLMIWFTVILLFATMFIGEDVNDAQRMIRIFGLTFQPSELAKVTIAIYLAKILTVRREKLERSFKSFFIAMLPILLSIAFIIKENFSTGFFISIMVGAMLLFGNVKWKYILLLLGIVIGVFALYVATVLLVPKMDKGRVETWMNRAQNKDDYQQSLAIEAIKNGGLFGKLPGRSLLLYSLPYAANDFIFAIIVEEYGLFISLVIVFMYLILFYRVIVIATKAPHTFGSFLAVGLVLNIVIQAFAHIGVNIGLLPVTGLPLPFVSKGGSSIVMTSLAIGIILSVANRLLSEEEKPNKEIEPQNEIELIGK